ncbi:MAG: tRNA uridine-5-carboxymethylaminomethyl(34) synthesis GTPase MnmE [Litoreibacter sp.]|nr:tRNA uridine-5-carboxymethylaminomethyl(34) synthesis GTPase MnmE [Litoreibacter sp.]
MDTIFALATARGKAGVSVIRLSGPAALQVAAELVGLLPEARRTAVRPVCDRAGELIDKAMVLRFDHGKSFTGEDVVEFQLHGSPAIVKRVLEVLGDVEGCRLAEPGEFTRRAMDNGVLDLSQVEGLADLIDAETEAQRRQAVRVFDGALGRVVEQWRADLVRAAALLEVTIDFVDEEVPVDVTPEVTSLVQGVQAQLEQEASSSFAAERIRDGFEVAIIGPPNIGKSTLLNALAGRDAAITSSIAGTTRDVIEVRMDLKGLPVTFLDTAGLRETEDEVESIGIARARDRAEKADLRIFLVDQEGGVPGLDPQKGDLVFQGKADLADIAYGVSGLTGFGVDKLVTKVTEELEGRASGASLAIRQRHREALQTAVGSLKNCLDELDRGVERTEIAAEELRSAIRSLESMIGLVDVESVLDEIFSSFCLGK